MCKGKKDEVDVDTRKVTVRGTEVTRIVRHKFPAESFALAYRHSLYTDLSIVVTEKKVFDSQGRQVNQPASALFLVHRVILAGISFVFEFKLQTLSRTETLTSTLHITADPHAFGLWLNFVYYGDTYVPEEHAPTFLDIHQFFGAEEAPNLRDERYSAYFDNAPSLPESLHLALTIPKPPYGLLSPGQSTVLTFTVDGQTEAPTSAQVETFRSAFPPDLTTVGEPVTIAAAKELEKKFQGRYGESGPRPEEIFSPFEDSSEDESKDEEKDKPKQEEESTSGEEAAGALNVGASKKNLTNARDFNERRVNERLQRPPLQTPPHLTKDSEKREKGSVSRSERSAKNSKVRTRNCTTIRWRSKDVNSKNIWRRSAENTISKIRPSSPNTKPIRK